MFRDTRVAHEWGFTDPDDFWKLSDRSQARMIAFIEAKDIMESYEQDHAPKGS